MTANPSIKVEVIAADHQNKPDVGVGILRGWYDNDGVDMVTDLTNSAVALACSAISAEKDRVCIVTAGGSSALSGASCNANTVHWTYDSWNLANVTGSAVTKQGGGSWFFVIPNGHGAFDRCYRRGPCPTRCRPAITRRHCISSRR
jgi:branched-chain amino acid transport system substrate-binding protein